MGRCFVENLNLSVPVVSEVVEYEDGITVPWWRDVCACCVTQGECDGCEIVRAPLPGFVARQGG